MLRARKQLGDAFARGRAEDRERAVLGRDDRGGELDPHVVGAPGHHQRELIQRQRPGHPSGRHERQAVDVAALDVLDQAVQDLVHAAVVDRERVRVAGTRASPERQHQHVVLELALAPGVQQPLVRVDPGQLVEEQLCAGVLRDPLQRVAVGGTVGERLANGQRPVGELGVGRHQRHVGAPGRQPRERQRGLQRGHAAPDDDHARAILMRGVGGHCTPRLSREGGPISRENPLPSEDNYGVSSM